MTPLRAKRRPVARPVQSPTVGAALSMLDQAVSSGTNFAIVMMAALLLDAVEFGKFAVAYVLYNIFIAGGQYVVGQELVLNGGDTDQRRAKCREALAFSVVLGAIIAVPVALAAAALGDVRGPLAALAVTLPALFVQDAVRFCAAFLHVMQIALVSDVLWLMVAGSAFLLALGQGWTPSPTECVLLWAVPGGVSGLIFWRVVVGRGEGAPSLGRYWRRSFIGYRFLWEFLALRASSQGLTVVLGAFAGLTATGGFRGATTLFGPFVVALLAIGSFGVPILRGVAPERRVMVMVGLGGGLAIAALVATVVLDSLPSNVGVKILGDTWRGAHALIPAVGTQMACSAVASVVFTVLRVLDPRATLPVVLWSGATLVPAFFIGYGVGGVPGAAWGLTMAAAVQASLGVVSCWVRSRRGLRLSEAWVQ